MNKIKNLLTTGYLLLTRKRGQSMLLTVMALGGTILGATTIAGLLTVYQIRQTNDMANSAKALSAADTGIEWGLYQFFKPEGTATAPEFSNGALSPRAECRDVVDVVVPCTDPSVASIRSVGRAANATRALQLSL
jgi:hypothetical protein